MELPYVDVSFASTRQYYFLAAVHPNVASGLIDE